MLLPEATAEDLIPFILSDGQGGEPMPETSLNVANYDPDWRAYPDMAFGTVRSLEYLDWRYVRHPMFKYHIVWAGQARRPRFVFIVLNGHLGFVKPRWQELWIFSIPETIKDELMGFV